MIDGFTHGVHPAPIAHPVPSTHRCLSLSNPVPGARLSRMGTTHLKSILIVPSFHYDVAYLRTYEEYLPQCFRILDEALRLLGRHPEYRFLVEQVILLEAYWERRSERREELVRFAKEGRLAVGPGLYVMPDMNHCDGESMYQQARIGRAWLERHLGLKPEVCWIADCWGHHAQLPQILSQCGYKYYVFWRCMRRDAMRTHFHWEGLDGTRLRTHWLAKGYGNLLFPSKDEVEHALDLDLSGCGPKQIRKLCAELLKYEPLPSVMLCNGGDFVVPQASAPDVVARLGREADLPPVRFATPEEYLNGLDWDDAAVVTGEFNSAFQGSFTSHVRIKQRNRELTRRLLALETLQAVVEQPSADTDRLWKPILKQQFHDIVCGTVTDRAAQDAHDEFDAVAAGIETEVARTGGADGVPAVFNALPFARTETLDGPQGRLRVELPPLGFALLASAERLPEPLEAPLPRVFETEFYRAEVGAQGYLTGLVEKNSGVELICDEPAPFGSLGMQMDYGDLWLNFEAPLNGGSIESSLTQNHPDPYDRSQPGDLVNRGTFRARIEKASARACGHEELVVEQEGLLSFWQLRIPFVTRMRLSRHSPRIEYETRIEPAGKHYRIRAAFPTSKQDGSIRHEIPFGIQNRGAHEHVAQHWVAVTGSRAGLAVLNAGTPGNTADDGILMLTLFRSAAMEYKAPSASGFQEGIPHVFRYAVLPHPAGSEATVVRHGHAFNQPPLVLRAQPRWIEKNGWRIDGDENVLVSSLRKAGIDKVFVRVYECAGREAQATLRVPRRFKRWANADGLQTARGPFESLGTNGLPLRMRPFEIRNLLLSAT